MCQTRECIEEGVPHPNAPVGGGGTGNFRGVGPVGQSAPAQSSPPNSQAPGSRVLGQAGVVLVQSTAGTALPAVAPVTPTDVNDAVRAAAAALVGRPAVGPRQECYDLADRVLRDSHARSAPDFGTITDDADYEWGTAVPLTEVRPGDILQFRNHLVRTETVTHTLRRLPDGSTEFADNQHIETRPRGHHTAVVLEVQGDTVVVAEQHVRDPVTRRTARDVRQNTIILESRPAETTTRSSVEASRQGNVDVQTTTMVTVTVSGDVWAYRPQPAPAPTTQPSPVPPSSTQPIRRPRRSPVRR